MAKAAEQRQDVIQLDGGRAFKYPQEQQWCPLISSPVEDTLCLGTRQVHGRPVTLLRPPLTTAGNAWGKLRGMRPKGGRFLLDPWKMASQPSPDILCPWSAPGPGCVRTAPSFWQLLSSLSHCAHCRREGLVGSPGRGALDDPMEPGTGK